MTEEIENVAEAIQQEESIQPQESHTQDNGQQRELSDKEINFQKLRSVKEQLERENQELKNWKQHHEKSYQQQLPQSDDDIGIDDDDIVEGKVVKKLYTEIKNLKRAYENEKLSTIPDRLRSKFSDFDNVVTPQNIEKLKNLEPEIYSSIVSGSDLYSKGVSAYKTLKAMGIVKDDQYIADKEKVQQNQQKPMSVQAIRGQGALSDANAFARGLTPELRKQLQEEMFEAVKAR
jgi:hypothetical protein